MAEVFLRRSHDRSYTPIGVGVALIASLVFPRSVSAQPFDWKIRPFAAVTFGSGTTLLDVDRATGKLKGALGVTVGQLGEVFGWDVDLGYSPGFFESGDRVLVAESSVTTLTGNAVVAMSRTATQYTLRPYFVGGFGMMRARTYNSLNILQVTMQRPAIDVGGGVMGSLAGRLGVGWELRHFRSLGAGEPRGQSADPDDAGERLSFWRANMALVITY